MNERRETRGRMREKKREREIALISRYGDWEELLRRQWRRRFRTGGGNVEGRWTFRPDVDRRDCVCHSVKFRLIPAIHFDHVASRVAVGATTFPFTDCELSSRTAENDLRERVARDTGERHGRIDGTDFSRGNFRTGIWWHGDRTSHRSRSHL